MVTLPDRLIYNRWTRIGRDVERPPFEGKPFCIDFHQECRDEWLDEHGYCALCEQAVAKRVCADCAEEYAECRTCFPRKFFTTICRECEEYRDETLQILREKEVLYHDLIEAPDPIQKPLPRIQNLRRFGLVLLARDGPLCGICHAAFVESDWADVHVDHIAPLARGGTNHPDNLQLAHAACNIRKGAK